MNLIGKDFIPNVKYTLDIPFYWYDCWSTVRDNGSYVL